MILYEIYVEKENDIVTVRQCSRDAAKKLSFSIVDQTRIITAASELARNIFQYALRGKVIIEKIFQDDNHGIMLTFEDEGPGIENINLALQSGYSENNSLGLGLPGSKKLMDEFHIHSIVGEGTKVIIKKWL
jgi:serine/threonine-protein kinase RsbT